VTSAEATIEVLPWGPHEWLSRNDITGAQQIQVVRVTMPPGKARARTNASRSDRGDRKNPRATARARSNRASRNSMVAVRMNHASSVGTNRARPGSHQPPVSQHLGCHHRNPLSRRHRSHLPSASHLPNASGLANASQPVNASHLASARRRRPASRHNRMAHPSPARHPNRVNPRPINPELRPRRVARARNRAVRRSPTLSGPPRHHTIVATSR